MKCPYCNQEMENGLVQSSRGIFWGKKKHKFFGIPIHEEEFSIADGWNTSAINGYCCRDCQKIIIEYD
ncbi:PF20097 family protein, partial [Alkalibacterium gilvum]